VSHILLVRGARQLITLHGPTGPRRGAALRDLGIIEHGALLVCDGVIEEVGPARRVENLALARGADEIDASGRVVMPGFVDSHTHLSEGGPWLDDYEARLDGADPLQSMTGWNATWQALRTASARRLQERFGSTLACMARHGTTTVEAKAGYGSDCGAELKILRVLARLNARPLDVVATYMAMGPLASAGCGRPAAPDLDHLRANVLPAIARRKTAVFADLVVEAGRNGLDAASRYMASARELGFLLKIHADEFEHTGGALLAAGHGAASADHLEYAAREDIEALARSATIATLLPGSAFHLGTGRYAPARALIDAGAAVALASNFNPNTSPTYSMPAIISLACSQMRLTPAEAIAAATINGACALRRGSQVGSLELGKAGDLIVLNTSDYRDLPCQFGVNLVHATVKRGRVIYREGQVHVN
jgi:imidazolonepropionase